MKVVFDSNVWRKIASPENFPKDPNKPVYEKISTFCKTNLIEPYLCETIFTLEAIKKIDRKKAFKQYSPEVKVEESLTENGEIHLQFTVKPGKENHPELNDFLREHFQDAINCNFQILHLPRIGGFLNEEIEPYLHKFTNDDELKAYLNKAFEVCRKIEDLKAGYHWFKAIGEKFDSKNPVDGIRKAPDSEDANIAKAVAEWADGDSIACTIGIGADYFCTNDKAKAAGDQSILASDKLNVLKSEYGLEIIDPIELVKKIK